MQSTISELYVDPNTLKATVQWSKGDNTRGVGSQVAVPTALKVGGTYLIYSEVKYQYVPTVGYVMAKAGVALKPKRVFPAFVLYLMRSLVSRMTGWQRSRSRGWEFMKHSRPQI